MTLDEVIDTQPTVDERIAEAIMVESTKWATLIYALGYPMDFTNPDTIELLDDDMIHEIAVAWHDAALPDNRVEGFIPDSSIEYYEEMIRDEIGIS